jgi:hypothetical protein
MGQDNVRLCNSSTSENGGSVLQVAAATRIIRCRELDWD